MKQSRKTIALLAAVLVLVILLLFANRNLTRQSPQMAGETASPVVSPSPDYGATATHILSIPTNAITLTYVASLPKWPTIATTPTIPIPPTATSTLQPPACTFPLVNVQYQESKPEEYIFSEPQVVLTAPEGNALEVAQWLPDNQQILITEYLRDQYVESNDTVPQHSISLYNLETGESKLYTTHYPAGALPIWMPTINGIVYSSANYTQIDKLHGIYQYVRQLGVSYGDPDTAQLLAENLSKTTLLMKPDGSEILYFLDNQISKLDKSLNKLPSVSFDPARWDYSKEHRNNSPVRYRMAWQPGSSLVFVYSSAGGVSSEGGYTFILDTTTGHICELNFGGWAWNAHWSPDGHYLAIIRPNSYTGFTNDIDLVVLDSMTGNLRTIGAILPDAEGEHGAIDFTWTPDNLHLLAFEDVSSTYDHARDIVHHELYIVDITSDESIHLFPDFKLFVSGSRNNFVWSPDGSKLLVHCILPATPYPIDRICLLNVQSIR